MLIKTKAQFYELAEAGRCGNTPRMWHSVDEALGSDGRYFGIRWMDRGNISFKTCLTKSRLAILSRLWRKTRKKYIVSESDGIRDDQEIFGLQGELTWYAGEWHLFYTYRLGNMRLRLAQEGRRANGWAVLAILARHLDPSDYDDLMNLFEKYTKGSNYPVIEFATTPHPMGRLNRRLVIWEIRHY